MRDKSESPIPTTLRQIAYTLRLSGWIGFWVQLVLGVVSSIIFLFAIPAAQPRSNGVSASANAGTGGSLLLAVVSLFVLYFAIYQAFRYVGLARKLLDPEPNLRPKKAETLKVLRFGLLVSLVGMLLAVLAAEAITGTLLAKSLTQAQGVAIYNPEALNRIIQPLDIFIVLANTHTITAHFVGINTSIWLINHLNKPQS